MAQINRIAFGIGTAWFKAKPGDINRDLVEAIKSAVKVGYRHLDNAQVYKNEEECGVALSELLYDVVKREDLWITTKFNPGEDRDPVETLKTSLEKLRIPFVDCYLIHTPLDDMKGNVKIEDTWARMEVCRAQGLAKHIGVSNFRIDHLKRTLAVAKSPIYANQIENHPYLQQSELAAFMKQHDITLESYSPLTPITRKPDGPLNRVLPNLAKKYSKTEGQVLLRWNLQKGNTVVTTSGKVERMKEQLDLFSFELSPEDVAEIDSVGAELHHRVYFKEYFD